MSLDMREVTIRPNRLDDSLLLGRPAGNLFVDNAEPDKIHVEGNIRCVHQTYVKKQQILVYVNAPQQGLHAELPAADVFHIPAILLVDGVHDFTNGRRIFRS